MSKTNIQVSREVRDAIASLGSKGDSYDDILRRLMRRTYDWDNVHIVSVPFSTDKGIQHMDIILPKSTAMNIDAVEIREALLSLCEDKGIKVLTSSEVPFF